MPTLNGSRSYRKKNGKIGLLPRFALPVLSYFSLQQIVIHHHSPRAANWHSFQCVSSCSNFQFGLRASIPAAQLSQSAIRVEPAFETSASRNLSMTSTRTKTGVLFGGASQNHSELAIIYDVYGENNDLEVTQVRETNIFSHMNENRTVRMVGEKNPRVQLCKPCKLLGTRLASKTD